MGSMMGDWPSYDPHNFSQLRPSDPSNPSVICSESKNILLRHLYQRTEEKMRQKRPATELLKPDHESKLPRASTDASS